MKIPKEIPIVIPVYKPDKEVLNLVRNMLKRQTVKNKIIEVENLPEAISMNTGIKKAKGEIVVTLAQDCVPEDEFWLEKLIRPLIEDEKVVATSSDLYLPDFYWKKYPFMTKMMTINERTIREHVLDARGSAYRKKVLEEVGLFSQEKNNIGMDTDLVMKLRKKGKIISSVCNVFHLHPLTNHKKIKLDYSYAKANGRLIRFFGIGVEVGLRRVFRAIPFFGILSILYRFPFKEHLLWLPLYALFAPITNIIWCFGFWRGFFNPKKD